MNEKIEELYAEAKQATKIGRMNAPSGVVAKKFAELIVQECIDIAQDRAAFDGFPPNDVNHIISEIKEHFGVEEILRKAQE